MDEWMDQWMDGWITTVDCQQSHGQRCSVYSLADRCRCHAAMYIVIRYRAMSTFFASLQTHDSPLSLYAEQLGLHKFLEQHHRS